MHTSAMRGAVARAADSIGLMARLYREAAGRDLRSFLKHGRHAPLWCQRIWFVPAAASHYIKSGNRYKSGFVVPGDWAEQAVPVESIPLMQACKLHWQQGVAWEDTGLFDQYAEKLKRLPSVDGCRTLDDVARRYEELDRIFLQVKREGRLRTRAEIDRFAFRERGAVYVHIGPNCEPLFGGAGYHRFAIARILNLPVAPAHLGMVHPRALASWKVRFCRREAHTTHGGLTITTRAHESTVDTLAGDGTAGPLVGSMAPQRRKDEV